MNTLHCATAEDLIAHGEKMSASIKPGTVLLLRGTLGAGKTTWVKGLARGLGYTGEVTSPTFALMHDYPCGDFSLYHWDLYRLGSQTDWNVLDLQDQLDGQNIVAIEWPEHFPGHWPQATVTIFLEESPVGGRTLRVVPS